MSLRTKTVLQILWLSFAFRRIFSLKKLTLGEMAPKADIRPIEYEWVKALYLEAKERNIEFYFHQCGSMFLKDGVNIKNGN